jgi:hypothetical protein
MAREGPADLRGNTGTRGGGRRIPAMVRNIAQRFARLNVEC